MAKYRKLGRTSSQRKALLRNQVTALINNGKIVTTEAKAKEVRKIAEGLIALACKEADNFEMVKVEAKVARKDKDGKRVKEVVDGKKVTVYDTVEKEIKNIPIYSLFFMGGYIFYRKTTKSVFIMITSVSTLLTIIFFLLDIATPMVDHKFPADYVFMCYGISAISLLSLVFSRIHIPQCRIISLWNTQGYNIYLYQTITFSIAVAIFNPLVTTFQSNIAIYIVYAITVFIISTILALIIAFLNTFGH